MKKEDLRVLKTKKALYEAFLMLLKEKTFEDLKVSDICNKALVNRSTFYSHFNDKYELLSGFLSDMEQNLSDELNKNTHTDNLKEYYMKMIELLLNHIDEQKDFYKSISINNKNSIIIDMIYDAIDKNILNHLKQFKNTNKENIPDEIISKFFSSGVTNVCVEWLIHGNKYSKKQILNYLDHLIGD